MDIAMQPGLKPPPGVQSDFKSQGPYHDINLVTIGLCLGLCTLLLAVQLLTKYFYMNGFKWEDYTAILAWALLIPFGILGLITVLDYGASKNQWNVTMLQVEHFASVRPPLAYQIKHSAKLSVLLQYLRIFVPRRNRAFYLAWLLIGVNVLINISLAFSFAFQCVPRHKLWLPATDGRCINLASAFIVSASTNTITDFAVFLLPLFAIWELQLPWERKLGVSTVFTVGLFACIASIMRLVTSVPLISTQDMTYALSKPFLWALAEVTSGMLCICFPVLPKLFRRLAGRVSSTLHEGTARHTASQGRAADSKKSASVGQRHKPYCQLEERAAVNLSLPDATLSKRSNEEDEELWKWDIERGMVEDGMICKTVTIDQTSRRIV
ncbi:MAG: hypothetical protein Q9222_001687 [Ikaeria aurantiellina]